MEKGGFVYIITNKHNTTLYTGVTSDLRARLWDHKTKFNPKSFTARYNLNKLVYYEIYGDIETAISRESTSKANREHIKNSS